ncbi:MAG TPA: tetratricopeptide repeat protein [Verrucomicrobiae bacterium]|nr:tetratricopeptide repeat protein [Verrucomicrobiae bacterium]
MYEGEHSWFASVPVLIFGGFHIWMMIDAVRKQEWMWLALMFFLPGLTTIWYFFYMYRGAPSSTRGFELPGAYDRRRIKELQAQIHHLDNAHHHFQLGDLYFQQGKLDQAEASYRAALERDPEDPDIRAHLGQCLLRLNRPGEARPLIEGAIAQNPRHEYGYTMMALAETLMAVGEIDASIGVWQRVTANNSYPRAKVQLAELYLDKGQKDLARAELLDVLNDDAHGPAFQRKRDRIWFRRAKRLVSRA